MPVFTQALQVKETDTDKEFRKKIVNYIRYVVEQLEYTLHNLDSRNISEIETDKTTIKDSTGSASIGSYIALSGANGESFTVGKNEKGQFELIVKAKNGVEVMKLDSSGNINITSSANITISGGKW